MGLPRTTSPTIGMRRQVAAGNPWLASLGETWEPDSDKQKWFDVHAEGLLRLCAQTQWVHTDYAPMHLCTYAPVHLCARLPGSEGVMGFRHSHVHHRPEGARLPRRGASALMPILKARGASLSFAPRSQVLQEPLQDWLRMARCHP